MDDEIEIPQYFICPISLQIMKDPVTTVTGITYDRESIEQWLTTAYSDDTTCIVCPVTKQTLSRDSDLTPNHMLRRLIQAWCVANATYGVDRIPTPKFPLNRDRVLKIIRNVNNSRNDPLLSMNALRQMDELANENEKNQRCMAEAGVPKAMVSFILRCFRQGKRLGLEEALRILQLTWTGSTENKQLVEDNLDFFQSLMWVLTNHEDMEDVVKTDLVLLVLKAVFEVASSSLMEKLNLEFFKTMVMILQKNTSPQATRAVLHILIKASPWGRNRTIIVEAGAVFELIEIELNSNPAGENRITELVFCLLAYLCACADGRQQLLKHAAGVAIVAKRLLRVSPATDDRALCVIESIARFSATPEVVMEMLRVNAVSKLCIVLQGDCGYLKKKATDILKLHSSVWSNLPCVPAYLLTWHPR